MSTMRLLALIAFCGLAAAADHHEIPLWASGAPGSEGKTAQEVDEAPNQAHGYLKVTSVHKPSVTVFLPPAERAMGVALIINTSAVPS